MVNQHVDQLIYNQTGNSSATASATLIPVRELWRRSGTTGGPVQRWCWTALVRSGTCDSFKLQPKMEDIFSSHFQVFQLSICHEKLCLLHSCESGLRGRCGAFWTVTVTPLHPVLVGQERSLGQQLLSCSSKGHLSPQPLEYTVPPVIKPMTLLIRHTAHAMLMYIFFMCILFVCFYILCHLDLICLWGSIKHLNLCLPKLLSLSWSWMRMREKNGNAQYE